MKIKCVTHGKYLEYLAHRPYMLPIVITTSSFCQEPYSPPQSNGEFFASYFIKTPSAESYTFLLTWLLFTCTLFTSMQKPFAGYQPPLPSGPTKFKHFSANASSSCYTQYKILLNFLFEIPTGSQTTPFEV